MKILSLASVLSLQAPNSAKLAGARILSVSPIQDANLAAEFIKCEIGSLSYVLALVCKNLIKNEFFAALDEGFLSGESSVDESEIDEICAFLQDCDFCIVAPENLNCANSSQIKQMLNLLSQKFGFELRDLNGEKITLQGELKELDELENYDGAVVFTHDKCAEFRGGAYFSAAAKIKDGAQVQIRLNSGPKTAEFSLDKSLKGTIAFLGASGLEYGFCKFERLV